MRIYEALLSSMTRHRFMASKWWNCSRSLHSNILRGQEQGDWTHTIRGYLSNQWYTFI